jgi:membrane protease YdiL (CAAX protease family)
VWILIAQSPIELWSFFIWSLLFFVISSHPAFQSKFLEKAFSTGALLVLIQFTTMVGVAVWLLGKEAWSGLRLSIRLPLPETFLLATAIPVGISAVIALGQYLVSRVLWFTDRGQTLVPPLVASYFHLPDTARFSLIFFAFFEEMMFRGLLQPYLVRRYGILRGIFLVGIVFAGWHFSDDFTLRLSGCDALIQLGQRLRVCLALSFVLGWLALKTKSIFPPTVAHTLYNVLVSAPPGPSFPGLNAVTTVLWTVLAYALFRYWPDQTESLPQMPD